MPDRQCLEPDVVQKLMFKRKRSAPRLGEVIRKTQISRNMLRVTFGGEAMKGFPTDAASANIKLLLPHAEHDQASYIEALNGTGTKPIKRTYTVANYDADANELDIDFALHAHAGLATTFALNAKPGDIVGIAGPSQPKLVNKDADWFLIAGDMTAIPAIEANLRYLPDNAQGHIIIEIQDEDDKRHFEKPDGMQLTYLLDSKPEDGGSILAETVTSLEWLPGTPDVWMAGESNSVREVRTYLAKTKLLDRRCRYTSGYWQIGQNEDDFQLVKRSEPDI